MITVNKKLIEQKKERLKKLASWNKEVVDGILKQNAKTYIDTFQKNIKTNSFNLKRLNPATVRSKAKLTKPQIPLYGEGMNKKNSFYNGLRIYKRRDGWSVSPTKKKHYAGLEMKRLFKIHEAGVSIRVTPKMRLFLGLNKSFWLKKETKIIKIPPRPIMQKCDNVTQKILKKSNRESFALLKKEYKAYLKTGRTAVINKYRSLSRAYKELEERV